jgi:hypothetical protein
VNSYDNTEEFEAASEYLILCVDCGQMFDPDDDAATCPAEPTVYHRGAVAASEGIE